MRKITVPIFLIAMAGCYLPAVSATKSLPIVEILGKRYYVYTAKKGDTLFGIARDQKWNDAELQKLNAQAISPLKKGNKLYYPVDSEGSLNVDIYSLTNAPVKELTHIVKKGESVYSIAKQYNLSVSQIYDYNPESKNGIKAGQELLLNKPETSYSKQSENSENPEYYTLSGSETISQVAKAHETTVASILAINPGINPIEIKPGLTLKMPTKGTGLKEVTKNVDISVLDNFESYTVQNHDTWETISEKTGVDKEVLAEANPEVKNLKKKLLITVPKVSNITEERTVIERDERELSDSGIKNIYQDVHKVSDKSEDLVNVRIAVLAENPSLKKDSEFIRGFLAGVDKIKGGKFKISLKVIDGSKSVSTITEQIPEFEPNLIFYTGDKNLPEYLLNYAQEHLTTVVNTFDVRNEDYLHNPYLIQLLTPSTQFNESVATNVYSKYGDHRLIIVGNEDESDQLAAELKKIWDPKRIKYYPTGKIDIEELQQKDKYIFYSYSINKNEVEDILKRIAELQEMSPLSNIVTLGRPNWILFDDSLSEELHKANTYIPSRFYLDEESSEFKTFNSSYNNLFNRNPTKSVPLYAAVGYDVATYFIPEMASAYNDINQLKPSRNSVQSEIDLKRVNNWSGFINPPVYLVNFTPNNTIDKIVIE